MVVVVCVCVYIYIYNLEEKILGGRSIRVGGEKGDKT